MILVYNGVALRVVSILDSKSEQVYDGPQYLYTRHRLSVRAKFGPQATSYTAGADVDGTPGGVLDDAAASTGLDSLDAVRHQLSIPRAPLQLSVGATNYLISPPAGLTSDANNGPTPLNFGIVALHGQSSATVDFSIETCINECGKYSPGVPKVILSHQWQMAHDIDENFMTVRTITGRAVFNSGALDGIAATADDYRSYLFHPVPTNFHRWRVHAHVMPDGNTLEYVIEDREVVSSITSSWRAQGITRVEINHGVETFVPRTSGLISDVGRGLTGGLEKLADAPRLFSGFKIMMGNAMPDWLREAMEAVPGILGAAGNLPIINKLGFDRLLPLHNKTVTITVFGNRNSLMYDLHRAASDIWDSRLVAGSGGAGQPVGSGYSIQTIHNVSAKSVTQVVTSTEPASVDTLFGSKGDFRIINHLDYFINVEGNGGTVVEFNDMTGYAYDIGGSRGTYQEKIIAQILLGACAIIPTQNP